jgi:hypothetical protein
MRMSPDQTDRMLRLILNKISKIGYGYVWYDSVDIFIGGYGYA